MSAVAYRYSYTISACRTRMKLSPPVRRRLDKLVLGICMVPTVGCFDAELGLWKANVGGEIQVSYQIAEDRREVVVLRIVSLRAEALLARVGAAR